MDNKTLKTWNTASITQLSNFLVRNNNKFIEGELLNGNEIFNSISTLNNIALDYSTFIYNYLRNYNTKYPDYYAALSTKVYLIHKDLLYTHSNILNIIKADFPNFIILDVTGVNIPNIDSLLYKYKFNISKSFIERYMDTTKYTDNNYTEVNELLNNNYVNTEKVIREAIYNDHLILIPIHKTRNSYRSNMYSDCITYSSFADILRGSLTDTYINYIGLQIPIVLNKDAKIVCTCINKQYNVYIDNVVSNIPQIIAIILYILNISSTQLNKIKEKLVPYIKENTPDDKLVNFIYNIVA